MLSICIIAKDEAENLAICLQKICNYGYEIIVVDTGSTDNTKQVAMKYTVNVFDFEWCDDFSAARNFAITKATQDFILMIDSDEFVIRIDKKKLEKLLHQYPNHVGRIHINNILMREGIQFRGQELINRVFCKKSYQYVGKIHEQIEAIDGSVYTTYPVPVYMEHIGYNGNMEERKQKSERNIRLLEKALEEKGNDSYIIYQLGKSYYFQNDYAKAVTYFERATEFTLNPKLEYVIDLMEMYGYALVNSHQADKALRLETVYNDFSNSADFVFMMGFVYMQNSMFDKAVEEFLKATESRDCKIEGVNSYLAFYNVGVIKECLGDKKKALYYYRKSGSYEPAKQGIKRCV